MYSIELHVHAVRYKGKLYRCFHPLTAFVAVVFNNYSVLPIFVAPGEPTNLRTENPGQRNITLWWDKPVLYGKDVIRYKVTFELLSYILLAPLVC